MLNDLHMILYQVVYNLRGIDFDQQSYEGDFINL